MDVGQVRELLMARCDAAGGAKAWARSQAISVQYVSDVISGRREPGAKVLAAMGLQRVVTYRQAAAGPRVGRKRRTQ